MKKSIIFTFIFCLFLSGCHVISDSPILSGKSKVPKILPGFGDLSGIIMDEESGAFVKGIVIHLASVAHGDGDVVFVLDTANSPSTTSDENGQFAFSHIPSGEYIIVITNSALSSKVVTDAEAKAKIWIVQPDQLTDCGTIQR